MNGYIALSNDDWCNNLNEFGLSRIVFWRKKTAFKALKMGEYIYFLNRKAVSGNRFIVGRGSFAGTDVLSANAAWDTYGKSVGFETKEKFLNSVEGIYKTNECQLGLIIIERPVFCSRKFTLDDCNVSFSPYIVSGKTIDEKDCQKLNEMVERSVLLNET